MKAKITRPDGTLIEIEGSPEEVREMLDIIPATTKRQHDPFGEVYWPAAPAVRLDVAKPVDLTPQIRWVSDRTLI